MYSLVYDFGFEVKRYIGYTTADIFPPVNDAFGNVWSILENYLVQTRYSNIGTPARKIGRGDCLPYIFVINKSMK